ncbi:leucyl/phenylalanyl-tRNA--protein transferase [Lebetimonas natsushimae]|uniref:Leucyl/phenylalanyl-tRNA--protein transferase n=1 Tax=Lebetimonas natsushimae TaxID=1936991 RepID=A0A292YFU9_9BACT|nr:leucyl/phenylalanyl-tRNA--protein transferase [Lebetimonas natsushimae]GAX87953.1 leucyl/phenylalanyl-tRNA--protein transferase [Lebetimonas natsushimae]
MIKVRETPPLYLLDDFEFPSPYEEFDDGFVGASYDLHPKRLLEGYSRGFFPWYQDDDGLFHWFVLDRRLILKVDEVKVTKKLAQKLRSSKWEFKINTRFNDVINYCSNIKRKDSGTWINDAFKEAYTKLYELGFAMSVESYYEGELVGGFYGVAINKYFSGESMFHIKPDASKLALIYFCNVLKENGIEFIDCQVPSAHLQRMGAKIYEKKDFIPMIQKASGVLKD